MSDIDVSAPISRRRILQGAAWAAPAVVVATAVPAAAASRVGVAGDITIVGDGLRNQEGSGYRLRINNTTLSYAGTGYVASMAVAVQFPKSAIAVPLSHETAAPSGWLAPVVVSGPTYVTVTFTKDPEADFRYYIPNFGGGFWIGAATGTPAMAVTVTATGTNNSGASIAGGGSLTFA